MCHLREKEKKYACHNLRGHDNASKKTERSNDGHVHQPERVQEECACRTCVADPEHVAERAVGDDGRWGLGIGVFPNHIFTCFGGPFTFRLKFPTLHSSLI